jgi:hypothetical protein
MGRTEVREFKPFVLYNKIGDMLEVQWDSCAVVAQWVNHKLTILRDPEDEERIVGVQITGFRQYFMHAGIRIDPEYDEAPPLTKEEEEELNELLRSVGLTINEDVGD